MKNKKKNIFQREGIASFGSSILAIICGLLFGLIILLASNPLLWQAHYGVWFPVY